MLGDWLRLRVLNHDLLSIHFLEMLIELLVVKRLLIQMGQAKLSLLNVGSEFLIDGDWVTLRPLAQEFLLSSEKHVWRQRLRAGSGSMVAIAAFLLVTVRLEGVAILWIHGLILTLLRVDCWALGQQNGLMPLVLLHFFQTGSLFGFILRWFGLSLVIQIFWFVLVWTLLYFLHFDCFFGFGRVLFERRAVDVGVQCVGVFVQNYFVKLLRVQRKVGRLLIYLQSLLRRLVVVSRELIWNKLICGEGICLVHFGVTWWLNFLTGVSTAFKDPGNCWLRVLWPKLVHEALPLLFYLNRLLRSSDLI